MSPQPPLNPETLAALRLSLTEGLGPVLIGRLIERFGSAAEALEAGPARWRDVAGIGAGRSTALVSAVRESEDAVREELDLLDSCGGRVISIGEAEYPPLLRFIPDPPPVLYLCGRLEEAHDFAVAIVGTRRCSTYGREQAMRFAGAFAQAGLTVVSGGARGIDTAAHRGALQAGGQTLVVLGSGLLNPYPRENAELFAEIAQGHGAIISEFPLRTPPSEDTFPRRNRIVSGLSLGTLVVEAPVHSGALITARMAVEDHNRQVMAIPGRIDSGSHAGAHHLIRMGAAAMVTTPTEALESLEGANHLLAAVRSKGPTAPGADATPPPSLDPARRAGLSASQQKILEALERDPIEIDELSARTGLAVHVIQADLTILQLRGLVTYSANRGVFAR